MRILYEVARGRARIIDLCGSGGINLLSLSNVYFFFSSSILGGYFNRNPGRNGL